MHAAAEYDEREPRSAGRREPRKRSRTRWRRRSESPSAARRARGRARPPRTNPSPRGRSPRSRSHRTRPRRTAPRRARRTRRAPAPAIASTAAPGEADRDHRPLAEPVGEEPPRQQREQHAEADGAEHDAGLAEREPVLRAQRRRERGQPDGDGGEARLRERPRAEDHPAIARALDLLRLADLVRVGALSCRGRPSRARPAGPAGAGCRGRRRAPRRAAPRRCSRGGRGSSRAAQPSRSRAARAAGRARSTRRPRRAARRAPPRRSRRRPRRRGGTSRGRCRAADGGRAARRSSRARRSSGRSCRLRRPSSPSAATSRRWSARAPAPSPAARARARARGPEPRCEPTWKTTPSAPIAHATSIVLPQSGDRLLVDLVVRCREIAEVERVAEHAVDAGLGAPLAEALEVRRVVIRRPPRARALREDLDRLGADRLGAVDRGVDAAGRGDVRADVHRRGARLRAAQPRPRPRAARRGEAARTA